MNSKPARVRTCLISQSYRLLFPIIQSFSSPSTPAGQIARVDETLSSFKRLHRNRAAAQVITSSCSHCRSFSSPPSNNNKLFVAGLSWSVDEKSLKEAFSSFGEVSEVRIMYDKDTGRSRGFGFVNFSREDEASSAKDAMDGKAFLGRPLRVSFALDKAHRESVTTRQTNSGTTFGRGR